MRRDYLIFPITQIFLTSILSILEMTDTSLSIYQASATTQFLINFGTIGLISGLFFVTIFTGYGIYQKISGDKKFNLKQFTAIILISIALFSFSTIAGSTLRDIEREGYENRVE